MLYIQLVLVSILIFTLNSCSENTGTTSPQIDTNIIQIKNQKWMKRNLNVSTFRNGDIIIEAKTNEEWLTALQQQKPAWCYYNNDPRYGTKYGKLYNKYALSDPRGLAPVGYRIATTNDWQILISNLGNDTISGYKIGGKKLKNNSIDWMRNGGGDNSVGFDAYPSGGRSNYDGEFFYEGLSARWFAKDSEFYDGFGLFEGSDEIVVFDLLDEGAAVRCVKE